MSENKILLNSAPADEIQGAIEKIENTVTSRINATPDNADQGLAQLHGDRPRTGPRDLPCTGRPRLDLADRRDHRSSTAGEDLGDLAAGAALAPVVDADLTLLGSQAQ